MEEEGGGGEEGQALLETRIEALYTPTRSPRQINQNSLINLSCNREVDQETFHAEE